MTASPPDTQNSADKVDRALLQQIAQDGNVAAMNTLYNTYRSKLIPFMLRMSPDNGLVEEAYNDVMLIIWKKAGQFSGDSKASTWVFSIAYRQCLKLIKRQQLKQKVVKSFQIFKQIDAEIEEHTHMSDNPKADQLNKAVAQLSAKQRAVVELSYFQGRSIKEVSEIAGCPENTIKTRLFHARQKIKSLMQTPACEDTDYETS